MLLLKSLLLAAGFGLFAAAAAVLLYDAVRWWTRYRAPGAAKLEAPEVHWRWVGKLAALAWAPLLIAFSIVVVPVVSSAFREVAPGYLVRDMFSAKREEIRSRGSDAIVRKLASDGIVVKQVMLRDLLLPAEYARGLEGMLLKEQENDRLAFEVEIKQKLVRTAELEAEAEKARQVKQAEGQAQVTVLRAKAESDAMQYTLPLKQKQIETTRLEAEAKKESTVKNAEAMAESKVIDSRAELQRGKMMAEAEANRIRVTSAADADRLHIEAVALRESPLLIQKIIAERLSDKVQIMMVPADGKFFFANDVLKSAPITRAAIESGELDPKPAR